MSNDLTPEQEDKILLNELVRVCLSVDADNDCYYVYEKAKAFDHITELLANHMQYRVTDLATTDPDTTETVKSAKNAQSGTNK